VLNANRNACRSLYCIFFYHRTDKKGEQFMKELIQYIAQSLVDDPDQVVVQEITTSQTIVLELKVAKEDIGKVIGKKGKTAQAMRTILSCASAKEQKRAILEIVE
jgi:hypothetical protein